METFLIADFLGGYLRKNKNEVVNESSSLKGFFFSKSAFQMLLNIKETSIRCNGEIKIVDMRWCRVMSIFSKTLARLENCARVVNVSEAGPMSLLLGKKRMSRYSSDSSIFRGKNTKEPIC